VLSWKLLIVELGVSTLPSQKQHKDSLAENPASSHLAKPCLCHVGDHLGVMPDNFCQVSEERMTAFAAHVGVEDLDHAFDLEAEATDGDADAKQPTSPLQALVVDLSAKTALLLGGHATHGAEWHACNRTTWAIFGYHTYCQVV